jgi:hypothetical protein
MLYIEKYYVKKIIPKELFYGKKYYICNKRGKLVVVNN